MTVGPRRRQGGRRVGLVARDRGHSPRSPGVAEVAVIGVPDARWGERPLALVVPVPDQHGRIGEKELLAHARHYVDSGALPKHAIVLAARIVDALDSLTANRRPNDGSGDGPERT